jgi:hypothetical protein
MQPGTQGACLLPPKHGHASCFPCRRGRACCRSANSGVDVSHGRVTKTFELIPSMAQPVVQTRLTHVRCHWASG